MLTHLQIIFYCRVITRLTISVRTFNVTYFKSKSYFNVAIGLTASTKFEVLIASVNRMRTTSSATFESMAT